MAVGIDELLEREREQLDRLSPEEAAAAVAESGAVLVDIRYAALRDRDGTVPGALVVERNELEWRLDPQCDYRLPEATVRPANSAATTVADRNSSERGSVPAGVHRTAAMITPTSSSPAAAAARILDW